MVNSDRSDPTRVARRRDRADRQLAVSEAIQRIGAVIVGQAHGALWQSHGWDGSAVQVTLSEPDAELEAEIRRVARTVPVKVRYGTVEFMIGR